MGDDRRFKREVCPGVKGQIGSEHQEGVCSPSSRTLSTKALVGLITCPYLKIRGTTALSLELPISHRQREYITISP